MASDAEFTNVNKVQKTMKKPANLSKQRMKEFLKLVKKLYSIYGIEFKSNVIAFDF